MKIIVYGAGFNGKKILETIKKYPEIDILGFADSYKKVDFYGYPIIDLFGNQEYVNVPIIITIGMLEEKRKVYFKLKSFGYKYIYFYMKKNGCFHQDFFKGECIELKGVDETALFYAEMSIVDFCNLNCKGCNHYSPIFKRVLPDFTRRIEDVKKISSLFNRVVEFSLLGGEPFLNNNIMDYIIQVRKILPNTEIQIVTNGLLLPHVQEAVYQCIRENRVTITISEYVPTTEIMDKITTLLENNKVDYVIKASEFKKKFYKTLSLSESSIYPHACISKGCINICDGKVAKCPTLLYIEELNNKFNTDLPNKGIYDLDKFKSGEELLKYMELETPLCKHCINYQIDWERCGKDVVLDDFVVRE